MEKDSAQDVAGKGKASSVVSASEEAKLKELTKLRATWTVWEQMQSIDKSQKGQVEKEYMANLQEVGEFDNIVSFWQLWNIIPHSDPGKFFVTYDDSKQGLVQPVYVLLWHPLE